MESKNNRGQEEIVGFAIIIVIVALIILFVLIFSLTSRDTQIKSEEVKSFLQSSLQYTSDCEMSSEFLSIRELIFTCNDNLECGGGEEACDVLKENMEEIIGNSWNFGPDWPVQGYELGISSTGGNLLAIKEGNVTSRKRGDRQSFSKSGENVEVYFTAYYAQE